MIRFEVQIDTSSSGWATVLVHAKNHVLNIPCSNLGGDSLGELARACVQLIDGEHMRVEVDCYGEPENSVISLRRNGGDLEVIIKRFLWEGDGASEKIIDRAVRTGKPKDWKRMERGRNKKAVLRQSGPFVEALRTLAQSFQRIDDRIGSDRYKRAWGFSFPAVELAAVENFLS